MRRSIGADTLGYVSLEGLIAATEQPRTRLCTACFDGKYPIALPDGDVDRQARARGNARDAPAGGPATRANANANALQPAVGRHIGIRPENVLRYRKDALTALDCPTDTMLTSNRRPE